MGQIITGLILLLVGVITMPVVTALAGPTGTVAFIPVVYALLIFILAFGFIRPK